MRLPQETDNSDGRQRMRQKDVSCATHGYSYADAWWLVTDGSEEAEGIAAHMRVELLKIDRSDFEKTTSKYFKRRTDPKLEKTRRD
jgi:hypothetical protein